MTLVAGGRESMFAHPSGACARPMRRLPSTHDPRHTGFGFMTDLVIFHAFGRLELRRGSKPLALVSRPKRLAVFVYLALSGRSFQRRDILQATFWPESDQERARHSLNETLYLLRRELGTDVV